METPHFATQCLFFAKTFFRWQGVNFGAILKNLNEHKLMETGVANRFALESIGLHWALFCMHSFFTFNGLISCCSLFDRTPTLLHWLVYRPIFRLFISRPNERSFSYDYEWSNYQTASLLISELIWRQRFTFHMDLHVRLIYFIPRHARKCHAHTAEMQAWCAFGYVL